MLIKNSAGKDENSASMIKIPVRGELVEP